MPGPTGGGGSGRGGAPGGSRGRGKKYGHKGGNRHFNNEDEIIRQQEEIRKQKAEESSDDDDEEDDGRGGGERKKIVADQQQQRKKAVSSDSDESSDDDDAPPTAAKGVQGLIEVSNPNRVQIKNKKLKELDFSESAASAAPAALNRKERDAVDAERRKVEYQKRHARGETEEAQRDMARLALVRKEREEAAKKIEDEKKAKEAAKRKT